MPYTFSGIFLVTEISNNKLICHTSDEGKRVVRVEISYFFHSKTDRPFQEAYESVKTNHVYFITGVLAMRESTPLVYSLQLYHNYLLLDVCNFNISPACLH